MNLDRMTNFRGIFPYLVSRTDASTGGVRGRVLRELVAHLIRCASSRSGRTHTETGDEIL